MGLGRILEVLRTLGNSSSTCWRGELLPRASTVGSEGVVGPTCFFFSTGRGCWSLMTPMVANVSLPDGSTRCWLQPPPRASIRISPRSTSSPKCLRKSAPIIGMATSARRKVHVNLLPPTATCSLQSPQQAIGGRSAPHKRGPDVGCLDLFFQFKSTLLDVLNCTHFLDIYYRIKIFFNRTFSTLSRWGEPTRAGFYFNFKPPLTQHSPRGPPAFIFLPKRFNPHHIVHGSTPSKNKLISQTQVHFSYHTIIIYWNSTGPNYEKIYWSSSSASPGLVPIPFSSCSSVAFFPVLVHVLSGSNQSSSASPDP